MPQLVAQFAAMFGAAAAGWGTIVWMTYQALLAMAGQP